MKVAEIMTTSLYALGPETPVDQVAQVFARRQVSGVPVVGPDGRLLGMITEEDLIVRNANLHLPTFLNVLDGFIPVRGQHAFEDEMRHMLATRAAEVMSEHLYTVTPDTDVSDAATLMVEKHANPLPVVVDGRPVGIISRSDIVRLMAREAGADEQSGEA